MYNLIPYILTSIYIYMLLMHMHLILNHDYFFTVRQMWSNSAWIGWKSLKFIIINHFSNFLAVYMCYPFWSATPLIHLFDFSYIFLSTVLKLKRVEIKRSATFDNYFRKIFYIFIKTTLKSEGLGLFCYEKKNK